MMLYHIFDILSRIKRKIDLFIVNFNIYILLLRVVLALWGRTFDGIARKKIYPHNVVFTPFVYQINA